jgi:hypothetical protein
VNRNHKPARWLQSALSVAALGFCTLAGGRASAEVTVAKGETWQVYVAGRVGAFFSYARGQGYPVPRIAGSTLQPGGGVDPLTDSTKPRDTIYNYGPGMACLPGASEPTCAMQLPTQGRIDKMRVRSGYYPNILTLGARKTVTDQLELTFQLSLWGTIEPDFQPGRGSPLNAAPNGTRDNSVSADFHEGYLKLEGGWGEIMGGRFLSPFGRGFTEIDTLYGHGYGVGFPMVRLDNTEPVTGHLSLAGPTSGMTGFGVLAGTQTAGIKYTTPSFAGVRLTAGVFDPVVYKKAVWTSTHAPRPEAEITYDLESDAFDLHVFASGGVQSMRTETRDTSVWGAGAGARVEVGPVRVGGGGFTGKGAGVNYAFDSNPALASGSTIRAVTSPSGAVSTENTYEIRNSSGFVGMVQVVLGPVDVGGGFGQTRIEQLAADEAAAMMVSTLESQTGISAALVFHLNESMHFGLDFINGKYEWTNGETQALNVFNAGVTVTF